MSVVKRHWRRFLVAALVLIVGAALLLWSRPAAQAKLEALDLDDGGHATLAEPGEKPRSRVVVIAAPEQQLNDAQMLNLAHDSAARVIQYFPPENGDCRAQQSRLEAVIAHLGGKPNLVAGIGPGSTTAWRWLASQDDDKAKALSVGFDIALAERDCDAPLPHQASHGQWLLAWNDNPDDDTAVFVRKQSSAETSISDYDTPLSDVLAHQLRLQLQGNAEALPVLEVPAAKPSDIVTLFYSGDGGWRDLDKDSAEHMASMGYPVVGIDTLRYYWQHKSPEQSAADLSKLMQHYREKWGAKRFVLAGYSFGADILPAIYNRLPGKDQQQVKAMLLLALAR
ncbi:AcvB/VirJ family lysyl-phosphatidylglycerol hydrolase, partial [Pseudomonas aeruginosa]